MKNLRKNNSKKNINTKRVSSESHNFTKSVNPTQETNFPTKAKSNKGNFTRKKNEFNKKDIRDKNNLNSRSSKGRYDLNKYNQDLTFNSKHNSQQSLNKKNFDDWIWGKHSVFEALNSDRPINRIWCTPEIFSSEKFYILLKDFKSKGVLLEEVTWNRISQLTLGATHQGIALQLASSETLPLNELINLSRVNAKNPIILALDGITDPHNLGAIIRSAEAFDCKGIVLPQRRSAGLTGTVAKVAAGALEHIPVSRVVNLNRAIEEFKKNGFVAVGLSGDGQLPISNFKEKQPLVVIVGAEDKGISLLTQKKCDFLLKIPLKGKTSSLNASVASAIALFHLTNH